MSVGRPPTTTAGSGGCASCRPASRTCRTSAEGQVEN